MSLASSGLGSLRPAINNDSQVLLIPNFSANAAFVPLLFPTKYSGSVIGLLSVKRDVTSTKNYLQPALYRQIKRGTVYLFNPTANYSERKKMEDDRQGMLHQLMLERMQALEEALQRAESGAATADDWATIRYECGMPTVKTQSLRSEKWD